MLAAILMANATCHKFAWHRCTPLGSCQDQVLRNRHRPAVYASSRAATFSVGVDLTSNTAKTLHDSAWTKTELYNLNWGVSTLTCHPRVGRWYWGLHALNEPSLAVSNTSTVLSLELPSVVSSLYTPNRLYQWHPSQCHCYAGSDNSCGMVCCSRNTNNPSWHLSELEVLLLNACCLHNRWMIKTLGNCIQSPNLSTRRFFSWKVRHSEVPLHAREVLSDRESITQRSYWNTTHRLRHIRTFS